MVEETFLKSIRFQDLDKWDVKRFFINQINSKYPVIFLEELLNEQTEKKKLSKFPEEEFGILGISNEVGMFDAYSDKGKNINQSYKIVKNDYIAYNPYRVNVGSIGIKKDNLKNSYISNAYVIFSTKDSLLADYLYMIMHTRSFNKLIRDNTTGSVRQTLSFENLIKIAVPVPSIDEQKVIIQNYQNAITEAEKLENQADDEEDGIDNYIFSSLGIKEISLERELSTILSLSSFSNMYNWDAKHAVLNVSPLTLLKSDKYKNVPIQTVFAVNPTTSYPSDLEEITFLPMECISDIYGCVLEKKTIGAKTKGYTKFKNNDVIFAKITPCMQNGKCAVVKDLQAGYGMGSTEFHVFRTISTDAKPEYLHSLLRTMMLRKSAMNYFTGSSGQQRVSSEFIENLYIPLPPLPIQEEIVTHINSIKENIKSLRKQAAELREKAKQDFENAVFIK
ncbi:restriction endonuclease subunit S [Treponema pectinovorum]|uniref:restriction endonuclease subunit S n=1 Tax=Treponema pectinovorum TaxID=164 RepID=UPI0011C77A00|nr:restriction endonuclease subunit S [Treponema pectinovorum]